ncbi:MAG: hypothetical protein LAP21_03670 [Acidobacteriia bacterium]|nr:hypothetical protein [Terriglobia bacterium]
MKTYSSVLKLAFLVLLTIASTSLAAAQQIPEDDQIPRGAVPAARGGYAHPGPSGTALGQARLQPGIPGIDSVVNFSGDFFAPGFDFFGNPNDHWFYNMIGRPPERGDTTEIDAPIIPVSLDLRNFDGSPRFVNGQRLFSDATQFVTPLLNSPIFKRARYSSSEDPTQFVDAVQRAEFFHRTDDGWHTILKPRVRTPRVITLIRGTYFFGLNGDGTCCSVVLVDFNTFFNKLFPATPDDTTTPIGAAENAGEMTTKDLTTLFFPNTFLFTDPTVNFFFVGFHTYHVTAGDAGNGFREKRYVLNYSSWVTPFVFFGDAFQDITPTSHELAEAVNNPFVASDGVHGVTPWWLSPNGNCQNTLEVGDVVEDLPNATFPVTIHGVTYHPQNETLLPWFEFQSPSAAIHGAYSYPDETLLTSLSPVEHPFCQ